LDAEFGNYKYKPAVIAGVSEGTIGGARAIEALIPILKDFSIWVLNKDVHFPLVNDLFDEKGNLPDDKIKEKIRTAYTELIRVAKVLKPARAEWLAK
jgi:NAD(P)H-dependent FMN reductase